MYTLTEKELWYKFKREADLNARQSLILKYTGLVRYVMKRLTLIPPPTVEYNDLYSCGVLGLISAVDRFDLNYGTQFQTYAICRIRGEILDESKRMGWAPRSLYKKYVEIEKMAAKLEKGLGEPPEEEEIASALLIDVADLRRTLADYNRAALISLYDLVRYNDDDDELCVADTLEDPAANVTAFAEEEELNMLIAEEIDLLPDQEKRVVRLYYKDGMILKEIGKILNVTESRVSQIRTQAMLRIRNRLKSLGVTLY